MGPQGISTTLLIGIKILKVVLNPGLLAFLNMYQKRSYKTSALTRLSYGPLLKSRKNH